MNLALGLAVPIPRSRNVTDACAAVLSKASAEPDLSVDALVSELCGRLGLDEVDEARHRAVPGGLMVLLARMRGHIDLPKLDRQAFCDALARFAHGAPAAPPARPPRAMFVRAALLFAIVIAGFVLALTMKADEEAPERQPATVFVDTAKIAEEHVAEPAATAPPPARARRQRAQPQAEPEPAPRAKTVDMVNLPRSTWTVTR